MLAQQPVEHPWFQDSSMPIVLSVGRLSPQKDFATLIRAIAQVNRHMPCRLIILGKGEQRAELERLVEQLGLQQRVWMPGFDPNPYRYMARATLFVLPSRWEGSPNALVEALACGIPVIATDSPGGAREILEDGRWGILTPVGNPEALAEAILQTLQRPVDREALRRRAQDFSVDKIANQYLNALGIHHGSQPVDLAKTSNS
ncbi:MAG: glycosyltransferase [Armatimonadota bacterium]